MENIITETFCPGILIFIRYNAGDGMLCSGSSYLMSVMCCRKDSRITMGLLFYFWKFTMEPKEKVRMG